jgi:hypothetical protein
MGPSAAPSATPSTGPVSMPTIPPTSSPLNATVNATIAPSSAYAYAAAINFQSGGCQYNGFLNVGLTNVVSQNGWTNLSFTTTVSNVTANCGNGNQSVQLSQAPLPQQASTPVSFSMYGCTFNGTVDVAAQQLQNQAQNQWVFGVILAVDDLAVYCANGTQALANATKQLPFNGTQQPSLANLPLPFNFSKNVSYVINGCNYSAQLSVNIQNVTTNGTWGLGVLVNLVNPTSNCYTNGQVSQGTLNIPSTTQPTTNTKTVIHSQEAISNRNITSGAQGIAPSITCLLTLFTLAFFSKFK